MKGDLYVSDALRNGAAGCVLEQAEPEELLEAIRSVAVGRCYLSRSLSQRAIEACSRGSREEEPDPLWRLTARERDVLRLMAEGYNGVQIAGLLCLSPRTVESHRQKLRHSSACTSWLRSWPSRSPGASGKLPRSLEALMIRWAPPRTRPEPPSKHQGGQYAPEH